MNTTASAGPAAETDPARQGGLVGRLHARQPALTAFGFALLALSLLGLVAQAVDPRLLGPAPNDVNVWVKPSKFLLSIGVFCLTQAWFFGLVRPERRRTPLMGYVVWTTIVTSLFELGYITVQAARGEASHFNATSGFHLAMYALMGVAAVLLVTTCLPLAWEIARRPAEGHRDDYRLSVVLGLLLTVGLGGALGGVMSAHFSHAVGQEAGHGALFGWNRSGGDLRAAHFFGMHLQQGLPLVSAALSPLPLSRPLRLCAIVIAALAGSALTLAVFLQALMGRPFLPGLM